MGKETKTRRIDVFCKNGHLLFERYRKVGAGRLQKVYEDEIGKDHTQSSGLPPQGIIYCYECQPPRQVAQVDLIHRRRAYVVFQAGIRKVVT